MFEGQRILVVGTGISGNSAADFLVRCGAQVICCDTKTPLEEEVEAGAQGAVLSPGVPMDIEFVCRLRERGIPIIGEMELAYRAEKGRVIAITGTNGKTTTTTLVWEIMKAHIGQELAFLVGNVGIPYTSKALESAEETVSVAEVSSFQLETMDTFHPAVSAILNITPDHLDRHHTMEAYVAAKESIVKNQTPEQACVLNYDNEYTRDFADRCPVRAVCFSTREELWNGYFLRGEHIYKSAEGSAVRLLHIREDMNLVGLCNVENVMAAIAIADNMQVSFGTTLEVIRNFHAVEHRIEFVGTYGGVDYYNDSKATNPDAAIQGIRAMEKPTVLLGGGYDKKNDYDEWIANFDGKVKWLVLIGQTKHAIAEAAARCGFTNVRMAESFEEACGLCTALAEAGDAVLLSPACASWGMFRDYEERGRMFKDYARKLAL